MKKNLIPFLILFFLFTACKKEPVASFEFDQNSVKAPVQINFTNNSTDATEFLWDFGDNSITQATDPSHL